MGRFIAIKKKDAKEDPETTIDKIEKELKKSLKLTSMKTKPYMMNQSDNLDNMESRNGYPKTENR